GRRFFREFRLGAGPRWGRRRRRVDRLWEAAPPRPPVAAARGGVGTGPAQEAPLAGAPGCDSVELGLGGVVGRWEWPDSVDWRTSVASVVRPVGRWGYNSVPGVGRAGTSVGTP